MEKELRHTVYLVCRNSFYNAILYTQSSTE